MGDFDVNHDFKQDCQGKDPDQFSPALRLFHQRLWSKPLPSGEPFEVTIPRYKKDGYLRARSGRTEFVLGSDTITQSFATWRRPRVLVEAREALTPAQRERYLTPRYTMASSLVFPVRSAHRPTMNQARGTRLKIADRIDLTLECIRRYYAQDPAGPLGDVIGNYADYFDLFGTFAGFTEFFLLDDLVEHDGSVKFFLPPEGFQRTGVPRTTEEFATFREATLAFIEARRVRIASYLA